MRCAMLPSRSGEEGGTSKVTMWGEWLERVKNAAGANMPPETGQMLGERIACSQRMREAIDLWRRVYENDAPWLEEGRVKGMNLLRQFPAK